MKKAILSTALLLCNSIPALAYVPPSEFIVKTWAQKHAGPKGVRTRSIVQAVEGDKPVGPKLKLTVIYRAEDGVLRSIASDEQNQVLFMSEGGEPRGLHALTELLYDSNFSRVASALKKQGVPVKTSRELLELPEESERLAAESATLSLGRVKRQIAWVIGKRDGSSDAANQLWVEKDTFQPLKFKMDSHEVLFESYRNYRDFPFPKTMTWNEAKVEAKTFMREELVDLVVNPPELAQLSKPITHGYTEAGNSASSEIRDLIQKYFEKAR